MMKRHVWTLILLVLFLSMPERGTAWSLDLHRYITRRAIDLLPAELEPFFEKHRAYIVEHSIDPDLWRNAGFTQEPPNHFLDFDAYGAFPFSDLPRDRRAAEKKFGAEMVEKNGLLPWRTAEMYERLAAAFKQDSAYAREDIKFFSAVVSHYVADAHVPLHAVLNYDGQLTGQRGVHARFEGDLFARFESRMRIAPVLAAPVRHARDFIFDTLLDSFKLAEPVLAADKRATAGRETYDDGYYEQSFSAVQPILERRISAAISGVAATVVGAWERAGKPAVPLEVPRTPRPIKRPGR